MNFPPPSFEIFLYQRKDPGCDQASNQDQDALSCLLLPVIAEIFPSRAAFRFRKVMLKETRFRKQKIIQADDIKSLDNCADRKETHEELKKGKTVPFPIHTADDEQSDISR